MATELILLQSKDQSGDVAAEESTTAPEVVFFLPLGETTLIVTSDMLVSVEDAGIDDTDALYFVYADEAYVPIYEDTALIYPSVVTAYDDGDVAPSPAIYLFEGLSSDDRLTGTETSDSFFNFHAADHMYGRGGNDTIKALSGDDSLFGNQGNDLLLAGKGDDTLNGGQGRDTLIGAQGADSLKGGAGEDSLNGGRGADNLNGGAQADELDGGLGNDTLTGGGGADTFHFQSGHDVITDYEAGDVIFYGDGTITSGFEFSETATQVGADVVISLAGDPSNSLTLLDTDVNILLWSFDSD